MPSALSEQGSTAQWRRTRAAVLAEEPWCRWCGGPAAEVDHIIPRRFGGDDRRENLAASCQPCNLAREQGHYNAPPSRDW
ncbi:HNH endonuclease [Streptomyces sp. NPDC101490]|uniref:HNH endonuclease n=1 Tax=Streptomyces sp. NPDC101490 TaxID=3366143 RepID=UPI0038264CE5